MSLRGQGRDSSVRVALELYQRLSQGKKVKLTDFAKEMEISDRQLSRILLVMNDYMNIDGALDKTNSKVIWEV